MMVKKLLLALVLTLFAGTVAADGEASVFDLRTMDGQPIKLDQHVGKGKWTLVMFWAIDCVVCERNKPAIKAFHDKHKDIDATVVGVSIDGMEFADTIREKVASDGIKFPNYVAELPLLAANYQIAAEESFRGTPTYWFFSPDGELKAVNPGPVRLEALESYMARYTS